MPVTVVEPQTVAAFPGASENESLYEIIDGQRVELPPMSIYATIVSSRLVMNLGAFARAKNLAEVVGEGLFRLPLKQKQRNRRPTFKSRLPDRAEYSGSDNRGNSESG